MRKQLVRNFGLALLAAASVYAQGSRSMTVQVPFGFHAGISMLPSGEYTVDTDAAPGVVRLRSADSKSSAMILTHNVQTFAAPGQGKLVFPQIRRRVLSFPGLEDRVKTQVTSFDRRG